MRAPAMATVLSLGLLASYAWGAALPAERRSDAPEERWTAPADRDRVSTYHDALGVWRDAHDINAWIGVHFEYDAARALQLSETQRGRGARIAIHEPARFFTEPKGICVDLARFAYETLRTLDPARAPVYLMIEFDPIDLAGDVLRRHWLVAYRHDAGWFVFADSKRPGHVAGPYADLGEFIAEYATYRDRRIVRHSERNSYERQLRQRLVRTERIGARSEHSSNMRP